MEFYNGARFFAIFLVVALIAGVILWPMLWWPAVFIQAFFTALILFFNWSDIANPKPKVPQVVNRRGY